MEKQKEPTPYDGFDIANQRKLIQKANWEARSKGHPEPYPLYSSYIPLQWRGLHKRWFKVTQVSKCLRWAGYEALGEIGILPTIEVEEKRKKGTHDHYRLQREYGAFFIAWRNRIYDLELGIYGESDGLARNYETGEIFVPEFKTIEEWFFKTAIKRDRIPTHLKQTNFCVALPDDAFQTMIYIRIWRKLFRHPEVPIRFGLVIYENRNKPIEHKACLIEYDENLMIKFSDHLRQLNECLDRKENIPAYIPKEAYVHLICPYRLKCPRGQEAMHDKLKKKNIPLWKIYDLKRRAKQEMEIPKLPPPQLNLFKEEPENGKRKCKHRSCKERARPS